MGFRLTGLFHAEGNPARASGQPHTLVWMACVSPQPRLEPVRNGHPGYFGYQIESDLVELIRPEYKRVEDEGRTFIQTVLQDAADIEPTVDQLRITLAPLSSPHRSRVVETLCDVLNKTNTLFPGTQLRMRYSVTRSHPEAKSGHLPD